MIKVRKLLQSAKKSTIVGASILAIIASLHSVPVASALANVLTQSVSGTAGSGSSGSLYSGFTPTHYAATTDQGTGDCSSEANACDLAQALATIAAGNVLGVLPGTYSGTPTGNIIWQPTNSGTSGNPIRIVAKYPALYNYSNSSLLTEYRSNNPNLADLEINTPVIGSYDKDYIEWYGAYINQTRSPPRASHGSMYLYSCNGCLMSEWVVDEMEIDVPISDNYVSLFVDICDNLTLKNFLSRGTGVPGPENHNISTVTTYGTLNFLIERATFSGVNHGIFIKGSGAANTRGNSGTLRQIKCSGSDKGCVSISVVRASSEGVGNRVVVENVLSLNDGPNGNAAFQFRPDGEQARYIDFRHNTIVAGATGGGVWAGSTAQTDMTFLDNVVRFTTTSSQHQLNLEGVAASAYTTLDYNLYSEQGQTATFAMLSTAYTGLAAWRTATGKEANSTESTPTFVDSANGDYRLSGDTGSSTGGARGIQYAPSSMGAPGT